MPVLLVEKILKPVGVIGVPAVLVSVTVTVQVEVGYGITKTTGLSQLTVVMVGRPSAMRVNAVLVLPSCVESLA